MSAFDVVTSSFQQRRQRGGLMAEAARCGLYAGIAAVLFALVGAYTALDKRFLVEGLLSVAQAAYLALGLTAGVIAALAPGAQGRGDRLLASLLTGAVAGLLVAALLLLIVRFNLRNYLVAAGPLLVNALSLAGQPGTLASLLALVALGTAVGGVGGALALLSPGWRRACCVGLLAVTLAGLFRDVFASVLEHSEAMQGFKDWLFGMNSVQPWAALLVFGVSVGLSKFGQRRAARANAPRQRRWRLLDVLVLLLAVLLTPLITNAFIAQVAMLVGLYVLMGMGLNVELGLAGLVDLGFVAFFAVGAYSVALLCSTTGGAQPHSFWLALGGAVLCASLAGFVFGLPVLRVRGDYLAMATLGLGEIVRVLVLSDALTPYLGGPQGIIDIARPRLAGWTLSTPVSLYYLALALAAVVGFITWRLQRSRIGRSWLALREDEEVGQALGIDPVASKLLAYTIGAAFAGAAGAVFAVLVGSVYPHSFQLLISINVLAILVIGGLGSLPGVLVGALVLIGLPELLREFGEFRYLFYGIALVAMMHFKSEGLWPAGATREARQ